MVADEKPISFNSSLTNYYKNKRIIVTGNTGFKGSWLTLWLKYMGAEVIGFSSDIPSKPCNFSVLNIQDIISHHWGDIRSFEGLDAVCKSFQPEIIFHLAAQPIVRRSYEEPKLTFDTNVGGTLNVLECVRQNSSVKAAVIITSDKCYKNNEWLWGYREADTLGGDDPYSASKGCAELVINSYCRSFFNDAGINAASTRAGNVIGGGDWAQDRIVPDCIRAWSEKQEVVIRNPQATRPWQHVLEPLGGYLLLGMLLGQDRVKSGEAFNFGPIPDVIQSVGVLIESLGRSWGDDAPYRVIPDESNKKESTLLKLCCDKALSLLGWTAILSFEETISFTASWYKKFYENKEDMYLFSIEQIKTYCDLFEERIGGVKQPQKDII
nr:CDP-glucose 4,6-dehydratase [uncultured Desulfobacter sp.]